MNRMLVATCTLLAALHAPASLEAQSRSTAPSSIEAARLVGTFNTAVALGRNSCTGVTVQPMPTIVTPTTMDTTIVLTHANISHRGSIKPSGVFHTSEISLGSAPTTYHVSMKGVFTSVDAFTALVTVREVTNGAERCSYEVQWVGTRAK